MSTPPRPRQADLPAAGVAPADITTWLAPLLAERLGLDAGSLDPEERLHRYGLTSVTAAAIAAAIGAELGRTLPPTLAFDHPTLRRLTAHLAGTATRERPPPVPLDPAEPIAIIGMACRLPGAATVDAFWRLLCAGTDAIRDVPPDRWPAGTLYDPDPSAPGRIATRQGGFLDHVDRFDAAFFGLAPREAAQADPQQRLALELAWEALEDAALRPSRLAGSRAGVFIGAMWSDYARLLADRALITQHTATGQDTSIISARIAYVLGLEGPALTVNTACSSALVAVHLACRSLRSGESTLALAGGVHLLLSPDPSIAMTKFGAMAPDGRCKAFDAGGNGYVRGEGGGLVVLRPLSHAQAAGDRVIAVIRGSAMNNDGPSNGLTAPNPAAQRAMLADALADARLDPAAIGYVEAHGTGTALGDPIEANALAAALCRDRPPARPLRIGSVKTNIGHLEAAAGAAGLIKLALALQHRVIPASLHFRTPNPAIAFDRLVVQTATAAWPDGPDPPAGGVSSFGFGGTNCHVILQAAPAPPPAAASLADARPVFVFAGNGGVWPGMARALAGLPAFAASLAASAALLAELGYPADLHRMLTADDAALDDVALGQPALCAFQLALADLLAGHGLRPAAVVGHSIGEIAAACTAGVLSRRNALQIAVARSRLQATLAGQGTMALAAASAADLAPHLPPDAVIAGENGPRATLLSGPQAAIAAALRALDQAGIAAQPVRVPVAYHSPQMDALRPLLERELAGLTPQAAAVPVVSTVTGAPIEGAALDAAYWGRNLREKVLFRQAIETLRDAGHACFLELAPHPLLAAQLRRMAPAATVLSPLQRGEAGADALHAALAQLAGPRQGRRPRHLLLLSARSPAALEAMAAVWADRLPDDFPDLCHTALAGRERFAHRLALHAADGAEAQRRLRAGEVLRGHVPPGLAPSFDQTRAPAESWEAWLDRCAAAFVAGAEIDAAAFDTAEPWRRIAAPTYPFERARHWLPLPDAALHYTLLWQDLDPEPAAPDAGLEAEATAFARAALATTPVIAPGQQALAARLARWPDPPADHPKAADTPAASLLRRVGAALPGILAGRTDPLNSLFPGGDATTAAAVYAAAPFAAAQQALARAVAAHAAGRALRVLEIGAGTGALTALLLAQLPAGSTLTFSDVSPAFLAAAKRRFADPRLHFALFDLDHPGGLVEGPFDAIVAANAVHAAARIDAALAALRARLAPDGILGLAELVRAPRWVELVFGITEGWWRFTGDPRRPDHALLDPAAWTAALGEAGFAETGIQQDGDAHAVILARWTPRQPWRIAGTGPAPAIEPPPAPGLLYCPGAEDAAALVDELTALAAGPAPVTVLAGPSVAHAAVLGAARALSLDRPGSIAATLQLDDTAPATWHLAAAVLAGDRPGLTGAEDRLRITAGRVQAARLDRAPVAPALPPPALDPEALYVLAGGLGRLGFACARFLVAHGARHLLLTGRSPPDPARLAIQGAAVRHLRLDLTAPDAAARLAAALDRRPGGLIHAAGIADGPTAQVLGVKLAGAAALARAAEGHHPDFILLFSSAAGVWGTRGHVAYAAANAALDRWAATARAAGLPATSIAFGRFAEPGLLTAAEDAALAGSGLCAMDPDTALAAALQAAAAGEAHRIIADIDWPRFRATYEARRPGLLFSRLPAATAPASFGPASFGPAFPGAPRSLPPGRMTLDRPGLAALVAELLGHDDPAALDPERGLFEQGLNSLTAIALRRRLEDAAGIAVPAATLFAQPTLARLADWLAGQARPLPAAPAAAEPVAPEHGAPEPVAIVGLACRLPGGASDPESFLAQLMAGTDAVGPPPPGRPAPPRPAGFLDGVDLFDAAFFAIPPREAAQMDPQQRLLLEVAWAALEHAGIAPDRLAGSRAGVFIGATGSEYAALARAAAPDRLDGLSLVGQPANTLAGRIAFQLGLHGPALVVDTACSSSLVALHLAIRALRHGEADLALAGGVNLLLAAETSAMLARAGLLAPDGRCKSFDAAADGYGRAEACGLAVLKPLARARADGDRILAVIRGSAVNHDGRSSSFTAPNGTAQVAVIRAALADAALDPADIDYVEAHGTGTVLGDPVELDALAEALAPRAAPVLVGAVKAAIGHAEAAAGIAGLAKLAGALHAGTLPPQPHFHRLNPHVAHPAAARVPTAATPFPRAIRRAGLSAFGASGTNAHLILESVDTLPPERGNGPPGLLLAAATPQALDRLRASLAHHLAAGRSRWEDACHTAWVGRARLRCWAIAETPEAIAGAPLQTGPVPDRPTPRGRRTVLPPTPLDRVRHWLEPDPAARPGAPPGFALGPPRRSARSGEQVREGRFAAAAPELRDHVVDGAVLLPAAGFLALAFDATPSLADIVFLTPLPVLPEGVAVQLVHARDGTLSLHAAAGADWTDIATARAASAAPDLAAIPPPGADAETLDGPAFAAELAARGFAFGPSWRRIHRLARDAASAEAELTPSTEAAHPAVLDAAIQTLTALLPRGGAPYLPARIARATLAAPLSGTLRARARLRQLDGDTATGDACLERADGTPLARLDGIELRRTAAEPGAWLHDVLWRPAAVAEQPLAGSWHAIGPGAAALGTASHDETGTDPWPPADGVIDLRPLHATSPEACLAATAALVRRAAGLARPPQLVLVSRAAAAAPPVLAGPVPAAAVLMGVQPVIEAEHPALRCRWIDLDPDDASVPAALAGPAGRYARRQGRLLVPDIVPARPLPPAPLCLLPGPDRSLADLHLTTRPTYAASPAAGEVEIAVIAAGLNFKDVLAAIGRAPAGAAPLGLECAGTVLLAGAGVTHLAPGDPVIGFGAGTLASRVRLPATQVIRRPDWLDEDTAASLPVAFLTAWHGLHDLAGIAPGQRVLVHAGAGGVGAAAAALARAAGARVFATASAGKEAAARAAGAEAVADSRSPSFAGPARDWLGTAGKAGGFDIVLHALGPDMAAASAALLRPGGVFLEIGSAPPPPAPQPIRHIAYDLTAPLRDPVWFADRMGRVLALLAAGLAPPRRTVLPLAQAGEAMQSLGQGRSTGKLVLRLPVAPPLRADATYLVTGGTGTVGGALAGWLRANGAGRVVLAARHAPPDGAGFDPGCETVALDITDRAALAALLAGLPGLRGVVHAAGVVHDRTLAAFDPAEAAAVLAPKIAGAAALDALTRDRPLDLFVLVSSSAGSIAAPGQAAYAAANAWLDRLAAARRAAGLAGTAIAFGPWQGGMFAALDAPAQARLARQFRPMAPRRAAAAFARALAEGAVHRLVMDRIPSAADPAAPASAVAALLAAGPADRPALLQAGLAGRIAAALGLPAGTRLDAHRALRDLGLNSLLAVSLRNELAAAYGVDLPATLLFDRPTLAALAADLLDRVAPPLDALDEAGLAALLEAELGTLR